MQTFTFRVRGHGQDLPGISIKAEHEQAAFKSAEKYVRHLTQPGWMLYCVETHTSLPIAKFV